MKNIVRCRSCRQMRWRNDPCPSVACNTAASAPRIRTKPISATTKHGFHAPTASLSLVADYDQPIHARTWRSA